MSSSFAYANTRDLEFILQEWLPTETIFSAETFLGKISKEDIPETLEAMRVLCKSVLESADAAGEEFGVTFEDTRVGCSPSYKEAFSTIQMDGWGTGSVDDGPDGWPLPRIIYAAGQEMMSASCLPVMALVDLSTGVAELIRTFASDQLKQMYLPKLYEGEWAGAMCLTETTSGSDVGSLRTRAKVTDDSRIFHIEGSKQFISFGDHDLTDNIVYALLARVEGAKEGSKGLSLFIVPRIWVNEDGSLVDNGIHPVGVEEKMGLHGMPTVRMAFGQSGVCRGWLLGNNPLENGGCGDGVADMFQMMNSARLAVGMYSLGSAANAFYNAREYCKGRIQGSLLGDRAGGKTTIIHHEDVRRGLLAGKAHVEALRAILYKTMYYRDLERYHSDPEKRKEASRWISFATPLCKAYPSDVVWEVIAEELQLFGGYGYCEDFPMAKIARDSKIHSIWEGTNYIQSADLVFRKFDERESQPLKDFQKQITAFVSGVNMPTSFDCEFDIFKKAVSGFNEIVGLIGSSPDNVKALYARRVLTATAQLYASWCLLEQAVVASCRLGDLSESHSDYVFYHGKLASIRYYIRNVTPNISMLAESLRAPDTTAINADLGIFEY